MFNNWTNDHNHEFESVELSCVENDPNLESRYRFARIFEMSVSRFRETTHTCHQKKPWAKNIENSKDQIALINSVRKFMLYVLEWGSWLFYSQKLGFKGLGMNSASSIGGCSNIELAYGIWLSNLQCWLRIGKSIPVDIMLGSVRAVLLYVCAQLDSVIPHQFF